MSRPQDEGGHLYREPHGHGSKQGTHPKPHQGSFEPRRPKKEILEAIEITLPEAGVVAFQRGFDAWREVVGAEGIEPMVKAHEVGSGTRGVESVAPSDLEEATPEE